MPARTCPSPSRDKAIAAANTLAPNGEPLTYEVIMAVSGLSYSQTKGAIRHARSVGKWRWATIPKGRVKPSRRRRRATEDPDDRAIPATDRRLPTFKQIRMRSYKILREQGMPVDEARGRVVVKAVRYGGG